MRPLRTRLEEARERLGLPWPAVERDYLLSWVLAGICRVPNLHDTLIFKGGTALRKCYFGDYRFSEDLDFSALEGAPAGRDLERLIAEACETAVRLLGDYAPTEITCERYTERDPHPGGQDAFKIRARFPWHRDPQTSAMVEVTVDEPVLVPPLRRPIIHGYGEPVEAEVQVYRLEEILAEKLRALLQKSAQLRSRGWIRSCARDYYDLWRVLRTYEDQMDLSGFESLLRDKCAVRDVTFTGPDDFFWGRMLAHVEDTWEQWLDPLVPDLLPCETVISELRPKVANLMPVDTGG